MNLPVNMVATAEKLLLPTFMVGADVQGEHGRRWKNITRATELLGVGFMMAGQHELGASVYIGSKGFSLSSEWFSNSYNNRKEQAKDTVRKYWDRVKGAVSGVVSTGREEAEALITGAGMVAGGVAGLAAEGYGLGKGAVKEASTRVRESNEGGRLHQLRERLSNFVRGKGGGSSGPTN